MRKYTLADLPPVPRGSGNRRQLTEYARSSGLTSASDRTYERLPLPYKLINGEARYDWRGFVSWLLDHINSRPLRRFQPASARRPAASAPAERGGLVPGALRPATPGKSA
jgi:hypothetical protein